MAINYELINKGGISLGTNFELLSEKPLDSRLVVPSLDGLQNYIDSAAAYEGMIVYVSSEKKHYEVKTIDGVLSYRPFGLTEAELNDLIANATTAAMEFMGATATLPENPAKGDMYKVAGENINIKIDDVDAKLGDSIVYDGEKWFLIPSGDDIEDTWRPVDGVNNDATLKFVDGNKTEAVVATDGTIKYNHVAIDAPEDVTAEGDEKTRTYITAVETDGYGHITGYKTATENVEDTNTEYTFESQVESSSVYFNVTPNTEGATEETIYVDAYSKNEADGKFVAKETGKSLISDDEIARLADVDNYDDEEVRGLISDNAKAIEDLEAYVGTIPNVPGEDGNNKYADLDVIGYINKKSQETLAAASGNSSETAASVKGQLDDYIGENNTRVKAVEDDVAAIKDAETGILKQAQDYADGLAGNYDEAGAAAGVQAALEVEIAKKVDKVEGKSLIDDSEIARLATLANYDDTQVKADIAKKADAEAMTTELGKKVDKVDGKDLISTSEIERLATLKNYDDTALAGRVSTAEGKIATLESTSATKGEVEAVDAKFADYNTTVAQKAIDDAQDARIKAIEDDYVKGADIADFETKENVNKISAALGTYTESTNTALANRYTKEEADGKFALIADAYDDEEVRGLISDNADAIAAEKERAEAAEAGLQTQINTIMNNPDAEGAINSINEFTQYVKDHGEIADGFRTDINKNKEDIAAINNESTGILKQAKDYADGLADNYAEAEHDHVVADITDFDAKVKEYGYATTSYVDDEIATNKAQTLSEAEATARSFVQTLYTGQVKTNTEHIAENAQDIAKKANSADVYAKTETYNKDEIEALLTWGTF